MQKVIMIGNLTRDPELTTTPANVSVCRFAIAVNRQYTSDNGEKKTDFFNITAWRGMGETCSKYLKKGNKVCVVGTIQIRNYEDNQGAKRTAVDIIASNIEFLTPKGSGNNSETPNNCNKERPVLQEIDDDDDIPF